MVWSVVVILYKYYMLMTTLYIFWLFPGVLVYMYSVSNGCHIYIYNNVLNPNYIGIIKTFYCGQYYNVLAYYWTMRNMTTRWEQIISNSLTSYRIYEPSHKS